MDCEIIVINLEKSKQRKENIQKRFKELNITNYVFLPAFDGVLSNIKKKVNYRDKEFNVPWFPNQGELIPGEIGNVISHIMACSYAMMKDLNHVIILEDDVAICNDFIERYDLMIKEMPKNWNHIYLGAITNKLGYKINDHIYRSMPSMGTHAYMIRKAIYKDFIREFSRLNGATDFIMSEMIRTNKLNSYSFIPFFAYQNTDFSIVQNEKIIGENDSLIFYKHKL